MISVEEAKRLLFAQVEKSKAVQVDISDAAGCVLAEDIFSSIDLPSFDQSAMDGYAVATASENKKRFELVGEIKAGDTSSIHLQSGQAIRIFTGAALPKGADAIIIQEKVESVNSSIHLSGDVKKGDCIRFKGSQIRKGELALRKNILLNAASIGLLASLGFRKIPVYQKPVVSIIVTGNEIIQPGNNLHAGQIYESNSFSLNAALQQMHLTAKNIFTATDDINSLKDNFSNCLADSDIVILTGGISVGKYDLVYELMNQFKVKEIFYKVAQKPGKPFFTGTLNGKLIFALPGNPAAVLVCFYEYIYSVIRMMQGFENAAMRSSKEKILQEVIKKEDRALFIRAKKTIDGVVPLEKQDSNMLGSFTEANCLIYVPNEKQIIKKGEEAEIHFLPLHN